MSEDLQSIIHELEDLAESLRHDDLGGRIRERIAHLKSKLLESAEDPTDEVPPQAP